MVPVLSTSERLRRVALELFGERGYAATSVADIAAAAGVSHMTFFRHFPTKESVVVTDPFDPVIAQAIAARPPGSPLRRAVDGMVSVLGTPDARAEFASDEFRRRLTIAAATPELRAAVDASTQESRAAVAAALRDGGASEPAATAAAGAVIGAATALLLAWAGRDDVPADALLREGLLGLVGGAA